MIPEQASDDFWDARPRIPDAWQFTEEWYAVWQDNWDMWCGCPL